MTDKALSYVPQILSAHQEAITAGKKSLDAAIRCGELLTQAKEAVDHGEWSEWLAKNCEGISDRTARTYMRLAKPENKQKLDDAKRSRGADLGVGAARAALSQPRTQQQKDEAKAKAKVREAAKQTAIKDAIKAASISIEDQLRDLDADEVFTALQDAEWETEKLTKLVELLTAHLKKSDVQQTAQSSTAATTASNPATRFRPQA